jgi:uncharacterized lipoprotein YajG
MRFVSWTGLAVFVISAAGCSNSPTEVASTPKSTAIEKSDAKEIATVVTADIKSWEEIQTWVASQRGKIVVVDIWSNS